jgi:hypothetical protein
MDHYGAARVALERVAFHAENAPQWQGMMMREIGRPTPCRCHHMSWAPADVGAIALTMSILDLSRKLLAEAPHAPTGIDPEASGDQWRAQN